MKKRQKKQVIKGYNEQGFNLFNQALGNGVATGTMTEELFASDWVKKKFPGYTIEEVEEACEVLRNDFISDEAFYEDFLRYNRNQHLLDEIERKYPYWIEEASDIIDEYLIPIALEVDRDFVEQYLEDHFTPMDEAFGDTAGTITAQFVVNNYMVGSRLRSTPTHKISRQERIDPKHTIIEFSGLTKRELESIEKILAKKGTPMDESYGKRDSLIAKAMKLAQKYVKTRSAEDFRKLDAFCYDNDIFLQDLDNGVAIEDDTFYFDESLSESYLTEAEDIDIDDIDVDTDTEVSDTELEDEPAEEETEVTVDDIDNDEDTDINEMYKKEIKFPILIEGFDEDGNAISMEEEDEGQYASEYGEAVVQQVEENKKFILSALDIYDFELFYESYDSNSNVKFTVNSNKELDSSILMNILKRYFNVEMDAKTLDYGEFTLNPVLDNKFIKIS